MTKLFEGGWFPLLLAGVIAFLMLTWRSGVALLEQQRAKLRQREDEFVAWVLDNAAHPAARRGGDLHRRDDRHPARADASSAP